MRFLIPHTADEALRIKHELGSRARVLAGGTDLMVRLRRDRAWPEAILSLAALGWDTISSSNDSILLGATVTAADLSSSVVDDLSMLAKAAGEVGGAQVRNMATLGGNVVNASPAADMALCLLVLDTEVLIEARTNSRTEALSAFITGPGTTSLKVDELVRGFRLVPPDRSARQWFRKVGPRSRHFISNVAVAGMVRPRRDGEVDVRIGLGSVAPTPIRARCAEKYLNSLDSVGPDEIARAALLAAEEDCSPIDDHRASAEYRRRVVHNLVYQFLNEALLGESTRG